MRKLEVICFCARIAESMSLSGKIVSHSVRNVGIELLGQLEIQKLPVAQEFLRNLKESFFMSAEQH